MHQKIFVLFPLESTVLSLQSKDHNLKDAAAAFDDLNLVNLAVGFVHIIEFRCR
jgi:hypothetical protein